MSQMFRFNMQSCVYSGRNCLEEYGEEVFSKYGKKACIVTSVFQNQCKNVALEDVKQLFDKMDIEYVVVDQVEENPSVENIAELYEKVKDFKPEFLFGIGGGSSLDAAKALGMLLENPGTEPKEVFYSAGEPMDNYKSMLQMPLFCIPTTAGTGSEVTGWSVLTRNDVDTKESMYMLVFPTVSFVDPRYIENSPQFLIDTGVTDALAHGIEGCLSQKNNPISKCLSEAAFRLFAKFKDNLLKGSLTAEDYDHISLAALMQGMAFCQTSTTIPHGMGYALSHFKGINHGLSCSLFLGEYIRNFHDQSLVQPIVEACGFKNSDEFSDYMKQVTNRDVEMEVTESEIRKWSDDFMNLPSFQWRHEANLEPITWDDIYSIYSKSLEKYMK